LKILTQRTRPIEDARRFQLLIDAVVDYAIYMLDPEGIVRSWNPGAERIKGYKAEEIIGQSFERFFTPEDRQLGKPRIALETARRTGRYEGEGWRQRRDGTRFWAMVVIDAIRDPAGRVIGFAKVTRDITDRRARQEALEESERRFRLLVNAVTDYALLMLDPDGRVGAWNAGAERIKGYAAAEVIGRHFSVFYTPEDRHEGLPQRALETALREGGYQLEGWRVRKNGTRFWAHVVIDPVRDEGGGLVGFAMITRDLTERRKAERELERMRKELHQSQKMEALGQLTGGIAHDFNNILAAIVNNLELARRSASADAHVVRQVEAALGAARNGAGLIQQLLIFARKQSLRLEPLDVNAAIEGMMALFRRLCPETIEITTRFEPGLGMIQADPSQLQTVLLNLLLNARDAMPEGGTATIATAPGDGGRVAISVTDTGTGMSPEVLEHAFEPFFTTKELGKGTGLGLSMVHGAIKQIGGEAAIESALGRGTTVRLYIPTVAGTHEAAPEPTATRHETGADPANVPLLFVEDDPILSMATVELLEGAGYRVHAASRGDQAVRILDEHPEIGLLVTDVGLPGMNGHEIAACGRSRRPGLGVLFITGYDSTGGTDDDAGIPGSTAYLSKPYEPGELFRALRRITSGQEPRAGIG
jgi:PAS domain S-box-containing protein